MKDIKLSKFITSHDVINHPLARARLQTRQQYFRMLTYFVNYFTNDSQYTSARLLQYRAILFKNDATRKLTLKNCDSSIYFFINVPLKQRVWLLCDFALISENRAAVKRVQKTMEKFLSERQRALLITLVYTLFAENEIPQKLLFAEDLISKFRFNRKFLAQAQRRILVTANMSAGKSTLINALIGKPVTRTSQEVCTSTLCYLYDKPFEDNSIQLQTSKLNLNASYSDLMHSGKTNVNYIASYFRKLVTPSNRICLIDSPGVNSAMNSSHGKITRKALLNEKYDKIIYVLNASKLGTDEEMHYLKYISENIPKDKVIFVLNKLDAFKSKEDSIAISFVAIRNDLLQLGYANPIICPLSAYCAWLTKMKQYGEILTADEEDDYCFYVKKFGKPEYDLSIYLNDVALPMLSNDDELLTLAIKCGLYGLESILYGGMVQ